MTTTPEFTPIETVRELDPIKVQQFQATLQRQQNLFLAFLAGAVAAGVGAGIWAAITLATEFQIGWMAVGIGFLVGWAVRTFGRGFTMRFGIMGATLSLVGCLLGNLFMVAVIVAEQEGMALIEVLLIMAINPAIDLEMLGATFSPLDLLFYGLALYYGYKSSFRQITAAERDSLYQTRVVSTRP